MLFKCSEIKKLTRNLSLVYATMLIPVTTAAAAENTVSLRVSAGSSFQSKNDIQTPNSSEGTRFSLYDAAGEGPVTATRVELNWQYKPRHNLRIMLAPLTFKDTIEFEQPVAFAGENYSANQPLEASYRFNSWRAGYHYSLIENNNFNLQLGATLKVRDAEIRLDQGTAVSSDDDLGLVPLLYVAGKYQFNENWILGADLDGLAGGPGRAIDIGVTLDYQFADRFRIGADLRVLEGGADVEQVYNFAQFNSLALALTAVF